MLYREKHPFRRWAVLRCFLPSQGRALHGFFTHPYLTRSDLLPGRPGSLAFPCLCVFPSSRRVQGWWRPTLNTIHLPARSPGLQIAASAWMLGEEGISVLLGRPGLLRSWRPAICASWLRTWSPDRKLPAFPGKLDLRQQHPK